MENFQKFFEVLFDVLSLNLDSISKQDWEIFQTYGYFILIVSLVVILYSYYYHLYRAEKKGERNYEKYSELVLEDSINDNVLENKRSV